MTKSSKAFRSMLKREKFVYMPVAYNPIGGRLVQSMGFKAVYTGGFVTGGSMCITEPLLTMDEQIRVAEGVAHAVEIPLIADGGAGYGEPLHTMRTVREFIRAGIAGIHIEDQLYPKRAHYHKYVAHAIPAKDFVDKIRMACRERDRTDKDFVIIARTDVCRFEGLEKAARRINQAADAGADMGMLFPRNDKEAKAAPKKCKIPLVYVKSLGNRDGRPIYSHKQMVDLGYKACIDALTYLLVSFHFAKKALEEVKKTGDYTGLTHEECVDARQQIEDLLGLEEYYEVEEETVEKEKWGKR